MSDQARGRFGFVSQKRPDGREAEGNRAIHVNMLIIIIVTIDEVINHFRHNIYNHQCQFPVMLPAT